MIVICAAIIRQDGCLLLVEQQGSDDAAPTWALPGGVCEDGELLSEALVREVGEETGLRVDEIGPLRCLAQVTRTPPESSSIAFVFDVNRWSGVVRSSDPDDLVRRAAFVSVAEAIDLLEALPWRSMREPSVALLRSESGHGCVWLYEADDAGIERLVLCPRSLLSADLEQPGVLHQS